MKLKNFLIVVKDLEQSKQFYHDLFGLMPILDNDSNVILTDGLVLQEEKAWQECLMQSEQVSAGAHQKLMQGSEQSIIQNKDTFPHITPCSNSFELYFEDPDLESFVEKLEKLYPAIQYVTPLSTYPWGQKVLRLCDPDGILIEVRTPMGY